ncbi:hypothetical protein C7475_106279 [Chitinophaga sp. S165]|nr:hypothetical protein C7475_106279 [Chitinophaga sp. S165]
MVIGIFRTNICTHQDKSFVITALLSHFNIISCTIDTEDCDKVMRVVNGTVAVAEHEIMLFIRHLGFQCDKLD